MSIFTTESMAKILTACVSRSGHAAVLRIITPVLLSETQTAIDNSKKSSITVLFMTGSKKSIIDFIQSVVDELRHIGFVFNKYGQILTDQPDGSVEVSYNHIESEYSVTFTIRKG